MEEVENGTDEEVENLDDLLDEMDIDGDYDILNAPTDGTTEDEDTLQNEDPRSKETNNSNNVLGVVDQSTAPTATTATTATTTTSSSIRESAEVVLQETVDDTTGSPKVVVTVEQHQQQATPPDDEHDKQGKDNDIIEQQSDEFWRSVWTREEVWSSRYRLSVDETKQLTNLEDELLQRLPRKRFSFRRSPSSRGNAKNNKDEPSWQSLLSNQSSATKVNSSSTQPTSLPPPCILLYRGKASWSSSSSTSEADRTPAATGAEPIDEDSIILITTRGIILAVAATIKALPWSTVEHVRCHQTKDSENNNNNTTTNCLITIETTTNTRYYTIRTGNAKSTNKNRLQEPLEHALLSYHTHHCDVVTTKGWQYRYIYRPGFTMAVTNDLEYDSDPNCMGQNNATMNVSKTDDYTDTENKDCKKNTTTVGIDYNVLDDYNGMAPLHYALDANHVPAIVQLLELYGADPNLLDSNGNAPLSYGTAQTHLEQRGAIWTPALQAQRDGTMQLFGQVAAVQESMTQKRQQQEALAIAQAEELKAKAAAAEMSANMQALRERGEQIDALNNKATDLNRNAADYQSMARQLKEHTKKKSKLFGIL